MKEEELEVIEKLKIEKEQLLNEWHPRKVEMAKRFIEEETMQKERNMVKGAIHLCELGENIGSEQNEERPVLIVSNDRINSTATNVKIIPLSKTLKTKTIKNRKGKTQIVPKVGTHFFLKRDKYGFLTYNSAAMAEGITTVSKIRLGKHLGNISDEDLKKILSRLKWVFDL
ncbi:type II toxin-antitoxin system PemK/MazF family toxin [Priestia megaterium]|uniref:type II toxin-antitoxin system PemK/MazF family toxin n=1 Tax=Priestia megaterium TaxID=1404 RepID=UPI00398F90A8